MNFPSPPGLRPDQTESTSWTRESEKCTLGLIETEERPNALEQILTVGRAVSQNSPNGLELTCSSYWVVTQHVVTQEQPTHRGVSSDPSAGLVRGTILEPFWLNSCCCRTNRRCASSRRFFLFFSPRKFWQWFCFPSQVPWKTLKPKLRCCKVCVYLTIMYLFLWKQLFLHHHRVRAKRNWTGQSSAHVEIPQHAHKTGRRWEMAYKPQII